MIKKIVVVSTRIEQVSKQRKTIAVPALNFLFGDI